jgi:hypothetical protein
VRPARTASPRAASPLRSVEEAFQVAANAGIVERTHRFAGRDVRFLFAGDALVQPLTRALAHLPMGDAGNASLTVMAWDSASTGAPAPPLPNDPDPGGPMWRRVLADAPPVYAVAKPGPGELSVIDVSRRVAWYWCRDAATVPVWEQGTPFLHIFHHWASSEGMQLVHAGAVATDDGGVLFVGKSGSGKSTSTFACVTAGMGYAGDDYVVIARDPEPSVHALYSSGKLDDVGIERFPELGTWVVNPDGPDDEKRVFFVGDHAPDRIAASVPLRVVLLPMVTGKTETRISPGSAARALAGLAPSTIFQMPGSSGEHLAGIAAVLRDVRAGTLEAGTDLAGVAAAVAEGIPSS